jgi:pimeloyl-ACP methyl ester carboxylesterase
MTAAPTPVASPARTTHNVIADARIRQLGWVVGAAVLGFLVPYVFVDRLDIPRDAYYAIYVVAVAAFFAAWTRASALSLRSMLARNWKWAVLLGLLAGALLAAIAFKYDATSHPEGAAFAGAMLWRGVAYGAADGLLLGAFPVLAVFAAFPFVRGRAHALRTIGTGLLAIVASLTITTAYHLGYPDFRSSKITAPTRGAAIWTAPTLLTLNPVGSMLAHVGLHVSAVVHSYNGDTFLPPHAVPPPTIALSPCLIAGSPARCGTLQVAENPNDPGGPRIGLSVAVLKAQSGHAKPDPVFWFAGWGSGGVSDDAGAVASAFAGLNWDRDVVFIDQRGTGSSKLVCNLPATLKAASPAVVTNAARRCAERIGPNLRYYTSDVAVDDFDQVRQALGYDKINIYGGSYGVTTGQIYLLRHGSHVRSAVFDSGSLLDVHIFERQLVNKQHALELLFARCAADTACNSAYPNLRREYRQLVTRLGHNPMVIPGSKLSLNPATFASVLDDLIAYTPGKAAVPRLIHLVATGQIARAAAGLPKSAPQSPGLAYQLLIQCNEPWASWRPAEIKRLSPGSYLAPFFRRSATVMAAACAGFPKADVPAAIGRRVHSDVPILFLSGKEDGADPPANITNARRELPNSRTVVFPAAGHGQLGLTCAQTLIADFVARGSALGLDTACARTAAVQPFDMPG